MIYDEGDCNPLHRRIPGEVISRRHVVPKRKPQDEEPEEVQVELRIAISLKPDARLKWLTRAIKMVGERKATSTDLFDIVTSRKFVSGLAEKVVRKLHTALQDGMKVFSDKQQRYLNSNECPIVARLTFRNNSGGDLAGDVAGDAEEDVGEDEAEDEEKEKEKKPEEPRPAPAPVVTQKPFQVVEKSRQVEKSRPKQEEGGGGWSTVTDEWTTRRAEKETQAQKDKSRKDKKRDEEEEKEAQRRQKADKEEEMRRKLEEESDNLFGLVADAPVLPMDSNKGRAHSRSRSMSSRTARRLTKENNKKKQVEVPRWRAAAPDALTGSRALLLNRNYQEDLPHMARPGQQAANDDGGSRSFRSRSRSRRRRR